MHFTQIIRTNPTSGAVERPWRQRDGSFVLGDPERGQKRHHKEEAVLVGSYSEALELVREGHSIRMSDGKSPPSLVTPASLEFINEPIERLDDLWTYTMPDLPFTQDDVMKDLRQHLLSQASDIYWTASPAAACSFLGVAADPAFDIDDFDDGDIELSKFNITRLAQNAYAAAFRPYSSPHISEEDVDELEQFLCATMTRYPHRQPSPMDRQTSPLCRTLLAAYHRWQMTEGGLPWGETGDSRADARIAQSTVDAIEALTGMPQNAIRNAMSRDGLSLRPEKTQYEDVDNWIRSRRGFVPLRETELPVHQTTMQVVMMLQRNELTEAFASVRKRFRITRSELGSVEQRIAARVEAGAGPAEADLRDYAKQLGLQIDTFIYQMSNHWER